MYMGCTGPLPEWKTLSQLVHTKTKRGQDVWLFICSYVAEKSGGCLYKLTSCNVKFHSLLKCKVYL